MSPVYAYLKRPSLIDFPGRISAVFFIAGCNFKCGFCHNPVLTGEPRSGIAWRRLEEACREFRRQWVDGAVITGGEPTLLGDRLSGLIEFLSGFGFAVKLDTNGSRPEVLASVMPDLDYTALDIKCSPPRYPELVHFNNPQAIVDSIALLKQSPGDYEFRTTVIESIHDEAEMRDIAALIRPARRYVLQPFIPRSDLPDPEMRRLPRTSPACLAHLKEVLAGTGCATEILVKP